MTTGMLYYKDEDILRGKNYYHEYNHDLFKELIDVLNEFKFNMSIWSPTVETDSEEEWFGIKYKMMGEIFKSRN